MEIQSSVLFATGVAGVDDVTVTGTVEVTGQPLVEGVPGASIYTKVRVTGGGYREFRRWVLLFRIKHLRQAADVEATLKVRGTRSQEVPRGFRIGSLASKPEIRTIAISTPIMSGANIPADGFVATGTMVTHDVTSVKLTKVGTTTEIGGFVTQDPEEGEWAAMFETLEVGARYDLMAADSFPHTAPRTNLLALWRRMMAASGSLRRDCVGQDSDPDTIRRMSGSAS
jgi:hypothetical protein